jgi:hypothetical protein
VHRGNGVQDRNRSHVVTTTGKQKRQYQNNMIFVSDESISPPEPIL